MAKKPKKRIQKKQTKTQQNKKMMTKGLSEKEIKRMSPMERKQTVKTIERNEKRNKIRAEKRDFIFKNNLNNNYIINGKKYTPSQLVNLSWEKLNQLSVDIERQKKADRKKKQRIQREEYKIQQLLNAGFSYEQAYKNRSKNFDIINELVFLGDRTVYVADAYLQVLWSDNTGESQLSLVLNEHNHLSTKEMIEQIHTIKNNLQKDGSNAFKGVPLILIHNDINSMRNFKNDAFFRGYKQKVNSEYDSVIGSNEWTVRGFANLLLSIMERTSDDLIEKTYNEFEHYAFSYLPEIHRQIFK